jgi:hypothetical protein
MIPLYRNATFALVLAFALALSGCSNSEDSPSGSGGGRWVVSGRPQVLGSIQPLPGVVVTCGGVSTTSGSDGLYELRNVREGTVTLTARKEDYDLYSSSLEIHSNVEHYVFMVFDGTDVSGIISNAVEGPIRDAKVSLRGRATTTDALGRFEFDAVKHGTDTLIVSHPRYTSSSRAVVVSGTAQQFDAVLLRDSLITVNSGLAMWVFEGQPNASVFPPSDRMSLSTNGFDATGQYRSQNNRNLYIFVEIPYLLYDNRVSVLDASIQIHAISPYPATPFQTYPVEGLWSVVNSYASQPAHGSLLYQGTLGDNLTTKYWPVLDTDGFNQMLTRFRKTGINYGITVQGGRVDVTMFHSMYSTSFPPLLNIKVRY